MATRPTIGTERAVLVRQRNTGKEVWETHAGIQVQIGYDCKNGRYQRRHRTQLWCTQLNKHSPSPGYQKSWPCCVSPHTRTTLVVTPDKQSGFLTTTEPECHHDQSRPPSWACDARNILHTPVVRTHMWEMLATTLQRLWSLRFLGPFNLCSITTATVSVTCSVTTNKLVYFAGSLSSVRNTLCGWALLIISISYCT